MFANRPPPKSGGNGKDGQPNDVDASDAEKRRVSFVKETIFNEKSEKLNPRMSVPPPRLDLDASSTGFGSGLSSFGNSDDGFGGFGSSFGSLQNPPSSVRHHTILYPLKSQFNTHTCGSFNINP